jgi:heme-degrading monooxygenase HmoA
MLCVTTRFRLRTPLALLPIYLVFRRMRRDLESAPGLVRHAFLIQSPLAVCTLSIWATREAMERFATVPSHVAAVRYAKRSCRGVWSAYWELDAVSRYASEWDGPTAWPELIPDEIQPWRLVGRGSSFASHDDRPVAGRASAATSRTTGGAWDWSGVRRDAGLEVRRGARERV